MAFQLWIPIVIYVLSFACFYIMVSVRLKNLGWQAERYHHLMKRLYRAEMRIRRLEEKKKEGAGCE